MSGITNIGMHNLSPGMVTTDLLMSGQQFKCRIHLCSCKHRVAELSAMLLHPQCRFNGSCAALPERGSAPMCEGFILMHQAPTYAAYSPTSARTQLLHMHACHYASCSTKNNAENTSKLRHKSLPALESLQVRIACCSSSAGQLCSAPGACKLVLNICPAWLASCQRRSICCRSRHQGCQVLHKLSSRGGACGG